MTKMDPLQALSLGEDSQVASKPCNYYLKNLYLDELSGLSSFSMEDLGVSGQYVEGSSYDNTAVKYSLAVRTCPTSLRLKASAEFRQDGGSNTFTNLACRPVTWRVELEVDLTFQLSELIAWAEATFQKIFAGDSDALSGGIESLVIDIQHFHISRFDISNFPGEKAISDLVNSLMEERVRAKISEILSIKLQEAMNDAITGAMADVGSKMPFGGERRLATCPSSESAVAVDSAKRQYWASLSLLLLAFLAYEIA